jgi:hypothetical protein
LRIPDAAGNFAENAFSSALREFTGNSTGILIARHGNFTAALRENREMLWGMVCSIPGLFDSTYLLGRLSPVTHKM